MERQRHFQVGRIARKSSTAAVVQPDQPVLAAEVAAWEKDAYRFSIALKAVSTENCIESALAFLFLGDSDSAAAPAPDLIQGPTIVLALE